METTTFENPLNTHETSPSGAAVLNRATAGAHATVSSASEAADSAARKLKPTIDQVTEMAHRAVDKAAKSAAPAVEWIGEKGETLSATQKKLVTDTSAYIAANPLMSVGIAIVAGFVISRMIRS